MKVLVTGATGFVGGWLVQELGAAGHEALGTPASGALDITDRAAVAALVATVRPDAIAHLAGMSFGPDARRHPDRAFAVNEGGTRSVMAAAASAPGPIPVLVVSSSEVYGDPAPGDLPLSESAPLRTNQPYGLSKVALERVAFEFAATEGVPVIIARAFNHTGPGQRPEFVVPALAARIATAVKTGSRTIKAGNVDVGRDFSDVRDVARAYRLLLETLARSEATPEPRVYNVASGRAVRIRQLIEMLAAEAGIEVSIDIDTSLVRPDDPPEIRGDAAHIAADVGWYPSIPLEVTLKDVLTDTMARARIA